MIESGPDPRFKAVWDRLSLLADDQIQRIIDNIDKVCLDTFNYDASAQTFCPLAIAHRLDEKIANPTDELVSAELAKTYFPVNILKGVPGVYYRDNRREDLLDVCWGILRLREIKRTALPARED